MTMQQEMTGDDGRQRKSAHGNYTERGKDENWGNLERLSHGTKKSVTVRGASGGGVSSAHTPGQDWSPVGHKLWLAARGEEKREVVLASCPPFGRILSGARCHRSAWKNSYKEGRLSDEG